MRADGHPQALMPAPTAGPPSPEGNCPVRCRPRMLAFPAGSRFKMRPSSATNRFPAPSNAMSRGRMKGIFSAGPAMVEMMPSVPMRRMVRWRRR